MRTLTLTLTIFALFNYVGAAPAQQGTKDMTVDSIPIERVVNANPEPDGKAYRLDLLLKDGTRVAYQIPPREAAEIATGMSKPAVEGGQNKHVATIVSGMTIVTDSEGRAVVLIPRNQSSNAMESLAIPISGAKFLVDTLVVMIAEAEAVAAKQPNKQ